MKILALILARGGSKRVPGKNIRNLCGKPLIFWTIEAARKIGEISNIMLSTDSEKIASICSGAGVLIPWLRPAQLAEDHTSSIDVMIHSLNWYESKYGNVDGVLLLQPTSPFRNLESLKTGIQLFKKNNFKTVVGVSPVPIHPSKMFKVKNGYLISFLDENDDAINCKVPVSAYKVNGSFYLISPSELRNKKSFFTGETIPLVMGSMLEAVDIDTEWDFLSSQIMYEMEQNQS